MNGFEDWVERTYRLRIVCELVGGIVLIALVWSVLA